MNAWKSIENFHIVTAFAMVVVQCFIFCKVSSGQSLTNALPCESKIFCDGPLLKAAQTANIFNDSKTFVDLHLKYNPDVVLTAFNELPDTNNSNTMRNFVDTYFDGPNLEFVDWIPPDWKPSPSILTKIEDDSLREWAKKLHSFWKELGRKVKPDVKINPDRYTLIYVDHPFIVPGGRFRETYYWDAYWEIKGLLVSNMTQTVRGMLLNFAYLVDKYGFVPNGNRIYYTRRSQPPFLIPSVNEYLKATGDFDFVQSLLPALEKEYTFWMTNRSIEVKKSENGDYYLLNQYNVHMGKPRPESFREDAVSSLSSSEEESARICSQLASCAESGWDFSSRWLPDKDADLRYTRIKQIVPVDLNSILCMNEKILSQLFRKADQLAKADEYMEAHIRRRRAIRDIFWVAETGAWLDFDLETSQNRDDKFYPSNIMPMWADCFADSDGDKDVEMQVLRYLKEKGVLYYPGGIPTSQQNSGQQWDYPNAWPPLQEMMIQALSSSTLSEARDYAFKLAQNWTITNWKAYQEMDVMFEKFDVRNQGVPGHGGEYKVQVGFGWTNGVMLSLLDKYGERLTSGAIMIHEFTLKFLILYLVPILVVF